MTKRGIEFRGVSFRYPESDRDVLHDGSFTLRPGESAALVGRNGSGKTTAVKLLTRLYDPTAGRIYLDGHDLREYDLESLHRTFGVIFQDFVRYALTARESIGFGDVDRVAKCRCDRGGGAQERDPRHAGRPRSGLRDLSRQAVRHRQRPLRGRMATGRLEPSLHARLRRADPDEPTASLDAFAEFEVFKAFTELMSDRISVVISHRFFNVRLAEHIVLDGGLVVGEGNHEQLMAQRGLYARMFDTQAEGYR